MINDPDSNTVARINTEARRRFRRLSKRLMAKITQKLISTPYQLMKQFVNRSICDRCVRPNQRIHTHDITPTTTLSMTPFNDTARLTVSVMPFRDTAQVLLSVTHSMTPTLSTTGFFVTHASHCVRHHLFHQPCFV